MKKYLPQKKIREMFSDPRSLKKGQKLWKEAEKKGEKLIKEIKNERKKVLNISP